MIALRDYQVATIDKVRQAFKQGSRSVCVVMPTGAGKTATFAEVARRFAANGQSTLWLAHRAELVDQAADALKRLGLTVGCVSASATTQPNPYAPVQVATVQTLLSRNLRPRAELVVADEAHHYVADEFGALLKDYSASFLIGPTATPERSDGRGLGSMFTRLVVGVRVRELVDAGHLVPSKIVAPRAKLKAGQIAQRPVDAYQQHANGRLAVVFSPNVALAEQHAQEFTDAGIQARVIHGEMPWAERSLYLAAFAAGTIRVLVNVYVLTEGWDCPATSCVILARGCGTSGTYLQMVGRVLRTSPGKPDAVILDLHGTSHVHGHPEDDRQFSLDGRGIRRGDEAPVDQAYCRVCGAPLEAGAPCSECGTAPREGGQTVTGEVLVPYASKRKESAEDRAKTYARWLSVAREKGYAKGWLGAKWKAVYGEWPGRDVVAAGTAILKGEQA